MNTLAMNVEYTADSGFLEESLVQLLFTNPMMNSKKKKQKLILLYNCLLVAQLGVLQCTSFVSNVWVFGNSPKGEEATD